MERDASPTLDIDLCARGQAAVVEGNQLTHQLSSNLSILRQVAEDPELLKRQPELIPVMQALGVVDVRGQVNHALLETLRRDLTMKKWKHQSATRTLDDNLKSASCLRT